MGTKVCRYNWHSADSLGWPFPILKYRYIFRIKYTKQFYRIALGNCYGLKLAKCRLQFKKQIYRVIYNNFRHNFVPYTIVCRETTCIDNALALQNQLLSLQSFVVPVTLLFLARHQLNVTPVNTQTHPSSSRLPWGEISWGRLGGLTLPPSPILDHGKYFASILFKLQETRQVDSQENH